MLNLPRRLMQQDQRPSIGVIFRESGLVQLRTALIVLLLASLAAYGATWYLSRPCRVERALQSQDVVSSLLGILECDDWQERQLAVEALGRLPRDSQGLDRAMMTLVSLLGVEDLAIQASTVSSMAMMGSVAVPALNNALDDPNPTVRRNAARALEQMGTEGGEAVLALIYALGDSDPQVETAVSNALAKIGPPPPASAPVLALVLRHENYAVRSAAAHALRNIGKDAVAPLIAMLHDSDSNVRIVASLALCELGRGAEDAALSLISLLDSDNKIVKLAAARALEEVSSGELVFSAYPRLQRMLESEDEDLRIAAIRTLRAAGSAGAEAIGLLTAHVESASGLEREEIALALGALGPGIENQAVTALQDLTRDKDPLVRSAASLALGHLGAEGVPAADDLTRLLGDEDIKVAVTAARALGEMGPAAKDAIPALVRAVETISDVSQLELRYEAIRSIGRCTDGDEDTIAFLDGLLDGQDGTARIIAACELSRHSHDPARMVPVIVEGLSRLDDDSIRARAADALGRIGADVLDVEPRVVSQLLELAGDTDDSLRMSAARAIILIDPQSSARLPDDLLQRINGG